MVIAFTSSSEAPALQALATELLQENGWAGTAEIQRWNPGAERWQEARLAVSEPPEPADPMPVEDCDWEVTARVSGRDEPIVAAEAEKRGLPSAVTFRMHVAAPTEPAARAMAAWIQGRTHCPEPAVRRLTFLRRWLWREWVYGGYGYGGGE